MTTIGISHDPGRPLVRPVRGASTLQTALLAGGAISSLLYLATDIIGGLLYPGYSFTSQAISELGAIGAPSETFVDAMFMIYNVLALAFGIGVFRAAARANRALRVTGALLIIYAVLGALAAFVMGPTFFKMQQRGAGSLATDAPHIILTAVLVALWLLAMGFGAFALGKRFRIYSLGSLLTVILFGALTGLFATQVAAGQSTPGLGVVERIDVYTGMAWMAVLGIALMRRPAHS